MNDIYEKPGANLVNQDTMEYTFASLGIWRKIYLILNWIVTLGMATTMVLSGFAPVEQSEVPAFFGPVLALLFIAYCYWLHVAIVKRDLTQLMILLIIQIIPFLNPISALIMWAIRSTSRREREQQEEASFGY